MPGGGESIPHYSGHVSKQKEADFGRPGYLLKKYVKLFCLQRSQIQFSESPATTDLSSKVLENNWAWHSRELLPVREDSSNLDGSTVGFNNQGSLIVFIVSNTIDSWEYNCKKRLPLESWCVRWNKFTQHLQIFLNDLTSAFEQTVDFGCPLCRR